MKRNLIIILFAGVLCAGIEAGAHQKCEGDWKAKMMAEKVAFLTVELNLTPEEAQTFWPIYNQMGKEKDEATGKVIKSYRALADAVNEGRNAKEVEKLLDNYMAAQKAQKAVDEKAAARYRAVLPVQKVAKLYIGEEKFRRNHIRRLHAKPSEKK